MKSIEMKVKRLKFGVGWCDDGTKTFYRASRWMDVKHNYNPTKRNPLWEYVMDEYGYGPHNDKFNPENGLYLDYFTFNGRNYAIEQFLALGHPYVTGVSYRYTENGKEYYLSGIDENDIYHPIYIELGEDGERVRVYVEK